MAKKNKDILDALRETTHDNFIQGFWNRFNSLYSRFGPPIDIYLSEDNLIIIVNLPGIESSEKLKIKINGNSLIIEGDIPDLEDFKGFKIQDERYKGKFRKEIILPELINLDNKIFATFKNGILKIKIPVN